MKKLTPIELEDGTVIYMEVREDIELVSEETTVEEGERELCDSLIVRSPRN